MSTKFVTYGGLSRGDSRGKEGSFIYGEGIDNISNPECIELSRKPVNLINNQTNKIEKILYIEQYDKVIYFVGKYIYEVGKTEPIFEFGKPPFITSKGIKEELTSSNQNLDEEDIFKVVFTDQRYLFFVAPAFSLNSNEEVLIDFGMKFYELNLASLFNDPLLNVDKTPIWSVEIGSISGQDILQMSSDFIVSGNALYKVGASGICDYFNFGKEKAIVGNGNGYRLYLEDKVVLWDGASSGYQSIYSLGINIEKVVNRNGTDYIFAKEGLFFLNGTIASPLYKKYQSLYTDNIKFDFDFNIVSNFVCSGDLIWCIENNNIGKKICAFGNVNAGYPNSYSIIHHANNYEEVYYISPKEDGVVIAYKDTNGTYGIDEYNLKKGDKHDNGYVIHREYINNNVSDNKKSKIIDIYSTELIDNDSIKISYSINNQNFEVLTLLNKDSNIKNGLYTITQLKKQFHKIVFKVELTGNAKLYDFIFYDD